MKLNLLELYKQPAVNQISEFAKEACALSLDDLVSAYHDARDAAPHRHLHNKQYFVGHSGATSNLEESNRREEHLAIALWNSARDGSLQLPGDHSLELLDYQFPLKAQQGDKGVGKVDLLGRFVLYFVRRVISGYCITFSVSLSCSKPENSLQPGTRFRLTGC
jgi:hypothetical protein